MLSFSCKMLIALLFASVFSVDITELLTVVNKFETIGIDIVDEHSLKLKKFKVIDERLNAIREEFEYIELQETSKRLVRIIELEILRLWFSETKQ